MALHNQLGYDGESIAEKYLIKKGYRILHRNWRYKKYEIDIIASINNTVVFVEVKTRSSQLWGNPQDSITEQKIRNLVEAANYYMQERSELEIARFDIMAIISNKDSVRIEHIEDAFLAPLN